MYLWKWKKVKKWPSGFVATILGYVLTVYTLRFVPIDFHSIEKKSMEIIGDQKILFQCIFTVVELYFACILACFKVASTALQSTQTDNMSMSFHSWIVNYICVLCKHDNLFEMCSCRDNDSICTSPHRQLTLW